MKVCVELSWQLVLCAVNERVEFPMKVETSSKDAL